jgi:hypothetical protein
MEDNYSTELLISKNDYIGRLLNILTPQIVIGIKSVLKSAIDLCNNNSEDEKYLMTFQNFLAQIPSWNQTTIDKEKDRIIRESSCDYLEDLVTCIHLVHFKIVTAVNPGNKNIKKIDMSIPKFDVFIHQAYCEVARNIWSNIFLFHVDVEPLEYQKNMREVEHIIKDSLINTVRNNIPIKDVINTYLEESEEYLENYISKKEDSDEDKEANKLVVSHEEETPKIVVTEDLLVEEENTPKLEITEDLSVEEDAPKIVVTEDLTVIPTTNNDLPIIEEMETPKASISFNNNDEILDLGTNQIEIIDVPKDLESLEKNSNHHDDDSFNIGESLDLGDLSNDIVEL